MSWYGQHLLFFWLLDLQLGPAWNETHVTRFSPKCKSFQVNVPSLFPQNLSRFSGIFMGDKKEDIDLKMKKQPPEIFCEKRSSKKICNFYRKAPVLSLFLTLLLKETPKLVFSYEICEIFKDTYFEKQLWTTTSDNALMKNSKGQSKHCKDQKQYSVGVLMKRFLKICYKFTGQHPCRVISIKLQSNFIEITFRRGCSPVDLQHIFRTPFYKNTYGRVLLQRCLSNIFHDTPWSNEYN